MLAIDRRPHAGGQPRHLIDVSTVAIASRAGHAGSERTGVRPLAVALQRSVAVILAHPASIVAQVARHFISLSGFDHHDGIRPQRIRSSLRLLSWSSIVSMVVVGQTLKRARVFTAGWPSVSRYNATICSQVSW